jgi:hypothetical protein
MDEPREPEITRTVPPSRVLLVVLAFLIGGIALSLVAGPDSWPWYVRGAIGAVVGSVLGGLALGVVAGVYARHRDGEGPDV